MPDEGTGERASNVQVLYDKAEELRKEFADLPEGQRSPESNSRLQSMFDEVNLIDAQITLAEMEERRNRAVERGPVAATAGGGVRSAHGNDVKSVGEVITTSEDLMRWATRSNGPSSFEFQLENRGSLHDMLQTRAVSEWSVTGPSTTFGPPTTAHYASTGSSTLLPVGQPIAPVPRQARLFIRDLMPKMTTTLSQIPYVRELNPTTYEAASAVAEGGTKPNATLSFQAAKADPTVIAATLVLSKQLFEDAAAVIQYINQRLPYIVAFKEDNEFVNGTGTWPNIEGIYNTSGLQSVTTPTNTTAQAYGNAYAAIENHDGTPTAVVLNPADAWKMFTRRAHTGAGTFDAGTPFSALPLTIWGVPSYRTRSITAGQALVGDFTLGGMIVDRESVNVQIYRERYAEVNQILLVCEERVGLAIFRPDLFVKVSQSNTG